MASTQPQRVSRSAVTRFYFHVCEGKEFIEDEEGQDLPGPEDAKRVAVHSARSLMAEDLQHGELNLSSSIEVDAGGGKHLFTVTFDEVVTIHR